MIAASAEITLVGPGLSARIHGDGDTLVADVVPDRKKLGIALRSAGLLLRYAWQISKQLRALGLRIDVRVGRRTLLRLGRRD